MEPISEDAMAALAQATGGAFTCELDTAYESVKQFDTLDTKVKASFRTRVAQAVMTGIAGKGKDTLVAYLTLSERARTRFTATINRVVVEIAPPAKLKKSADDMQIDVNEGAGTITCIFKLATVADGKITEGWGPRVDAAMGLCALTDGYIDKAKLAMAAVTAESMAVLKGLEAPDVDWSFIDELGYKKLEEDARRTAIANVAVALKNGMLERTTGLVRHLARSQRATQAFFEHVKSLQLWVNHDSKGVKAPFELSENGNGVLRIGVRLNALDQQSLGWGPAVDERFALQVVDEEGMRAVQAACAQHEQALPHGVHLDMDWSSLIVADRWKKMKPEERQAVYTSIAKKSLLSGVSDRREGLVSLFARSSRARALFVEKVGTVRVRLEMTGKPVALLQDGGVLVVPLLVTQVDEGQTWATLVSNVLSLRVDEEEAIRKAEAAVEKAAQGMRVVLDWGTFMEEPALLRAPLDKRLAQIAAFTGIVTGGVCGRTGLIGGAGASLSSVVDTIVVRVAPTVRAKGLYDLRYGANRILEITVKASALTSAAAVESFLPLFQAARPEAGSSDDVQPYHLLVEGDPSASSALGQAPPVPNVLLDSVGDGLTPMTAPRSSATSAAPAKAGPPVAKAPTPIVKAVAPPPSKVPSSPPPAKAASPPPVKAASPPPAKAASPPPVRAPAPTATTPTPTKAPAPAAAAASSVVVGGAPSEWGCSAAWDQCVPLVRSLTSVGFSGVAEVDWSFLESAEFAAHPDATKKAIVSSINSRIFLPLSKELTKVAKSHAMYTEAVGRLTRILFRWDSSEGVLDMASGKAGKTHYSVAVADDALVVVCNMSQHMTGVLPSLEAKLQVAFGMHHLVVVETLTAALARRGAASKLECFLDQSFVPHANFMREPVTADSIAWWAQLAKETETALDRVLKAMEALRKDPIFDESFRARFSSLLVQPDPTYSVRDMTPPPSWAALENKEQYQLQLRFNMNDGAQAGNAAPVKLAALLNVKLAQAIAAARKDAAEQLTRFKATLGGTDAVLLDFFSSPEFAALPEAKAIEGCTALKPWLAGILRQLGTVVSRNAAVFKAKCSAVHFGLDAANTLRGGVDSEVALGADNVLRIVQNMVSAAKPDATVAQRVDNVLDVTMANVSNELAIEMKTRSASLSTALQIPGLVVNIDFGFEADPTFTALLPQAKQAKVKRMKAHLELVLDSLVKLGPAACRGLVAVMLVPDVTNKVHDPFTGATDADHYSVTLTADGLLRVAVNLEEIDKQLGRCLHKVTQQTSLHRARQDGANNVYHSGVEVFEWDTLQYPPLLNDSIPAHFDLSIDHCKEVTRAWASAINKSRIESPAGAAALAQLSNFVVRMNKRLEPGVEWQTLHEGDSLVLALSFRFVKERHSLAVLEWKEALEWVLRSTVEVEKHHGMGRVAKAEALLASTFGRPCPIVMDWPTYVDKEEFLELEADGVRTYIRQVSTQLLHSVVEEGLVKICKHPVGGREVKARVKNVFITFGPNVDVTQRLRQPAKVVVETSGRVHISFRNLLGAVRTDYKSRIEFEMGIIIMVAEHNATARRDAVSAAIGKIPITYNPAFTLADDFRFGVDIAVQPTVVDAVVAGIVEHVCARSTDSLRSIWDQASKSVRGVRINVLWDNSLNSVHGRVSFNAADGILELEWDLGVILNFADSHNWRPRIAHVLHLLDPIGQAEANAKVALTSKELDATFAVAIDWDSFVKAPQWLALPAADRYERMHNLGGEVSRQVLLGYWGLPGLLFFDKVRDDMQKRVKLVQLAVNPTNTAPKTYVTALTGTTLRVTLSLDELCTNQITKLGGCRERVEKVMALRPLVEKCAQEEVQQRNVAPVAAAIGKTVNLLWDSFMTSEDYLKFRDYVAYIRYIGSMISPLLLGSDHRPEGLPWLIANNREAAEFLALVTTVDVTIDTTCKTKPPQERFVNPNMSATQDGATLSLTVRRDWMETSKSGAGMDTPPDNEQYHNGCGAVVEWLLTPEICTANEANHVETYRIELISLEEQRRASIIRQWDHTCARNIEEYNDYVNEYAAAGRRNCSNCKGTSWDSFFKRQCSSCDGTGKCQSRMRAPQMPINPPKPNFPDMGVTDWYKLALVETRYTVEGKLALVRPEEPAPTQPRFSEQPCPRWTAMRQHSLGGEDTRPVDMAASVLPGRTAYQQTMGGGAGASDDGDDETGELPAARKAAPSALTSAIEKRGKKPAAVPAPPPPRKK